MSRTAFLSAIVAGGLFWLLVFTAIAHAHPVDDLCAPGLHTEDGCQPIIHSLYLSTPEFFAAHKRYWHCRRRLAVDDIGMIAGCVDGNTVLSTLLGETYQENLGEKALREYWNVIPAHPELDYIDEGDVQKSVERADAQTGACELTRMIAGAVLWQCRQKQMVLIGRIQAAMIKRPPVCRRPRR